jgi:hypothetical protein|tara:strand:- start:54 stop:155 length:102 start_codon:yes stop_codon:yes gene_type:complete
MDKKKEKSDAKDEDALDGKTLHDLYRHTTKLIK